MCIGNGSFRIDISARKLTAMLSLLVVLIGVLSYGDDVVAHFAVQYLAADNRQQLEVITEILDDQRWQQDFDVCLRIRGDDSKQSVLECLQEANDKRNSRRNRKKVP